MHITFYLIPNFNVISFIQSKNFIRENHTHPWYLISFTTLNPVLFSYFFYLLHSCYLPTSLSFISFLFIPASSPNILSFFITCSMLSNGTCRVRTKSSAKAHNLYLCALTCNSSYCIVYYLCLIVSTTKIKSKGDE